jgi:hypothetical protein
MLLLLFSPNLLLTYETLKVLSLKFLKVLVVTGLLLFLFILSTFEEPKALSKLNPGLESS